MSERGDALCELLPWDTDFFNFRIGRIKGHTLAKSQTPEITEWASLHQVDCLYFLARGDDPRALEAAAEAGFKLVDMRLTLERVCASTAMPTAARESSVVIREVRMEDIPALQAIARNNHVQTRFFSDLRFPRERAEEFYSLWIKLECESKAQKVFTAAEPTGELSGYITCHFDVAKKTGQIGLAGVKAEARGKSLGTRLVCSATDWLEAQGARTITVVTQGANIPAQRLYQSCGFLSRDLQLWYHKWY